MAKKIIPFIILSFVISIVVISLISAQNYYGNNQNYQNSNSYDNQNYQHHTNYISSNPSTFVSYGYSGNEYSNPNMYCNCQQGNQNYYPNYSSNYTNNYIDNKGYIYQAYNGYSNAGYYPNHGILMYYN